MLQIRIQTGDAAYDANPRYEQIWTRQRSDDLYQVCCIPFFLYDLSLGDIVKVETHDGVPRVQGVAERSGHHTFRAWFGKAFFPVVRDQIVDQMMATPGCLFEWYGTNLLAIDAENDVVAKAVAAFLENAERRGQLQYETGRT